MSLSQRIRLLRDFLKGKTSERQNMLIDQWFHAIDDQQPIDLWETADQKELTRSGIYQGIELHLAGASDKRARIVVIRRRWMVAAGILMILVAGYLFLDPRNNSQPLALYHTVIALPGEVKKIILPDSSVVWLKSGSSLQYNDAYSSANRELTLKEGEAFFEVRKDPDHPFIVHSGPLNVRVLGTAFDIQSYSGRPQMQIWVEHGRVQVSDSLRVLQELTGNMRFQWSRGDGSFSCDSLRWQQALAWQKGILLLEGASFTELAFQLKEIYNIELITHRPDIIKLRYDAKFFIRTPVNDIAATLAAVHGIRVTRTGNIIEFH